MSELPKSTDSKSIKVLLTLNGIHKNLLLAQKELLKVPFGFGNSARYLIEVADADLSKGISLGLIKEQKP